jgi:peptide/nickel transport system permease protein
MRTLWLVGQKIGYFFTVLFLSSLVLAVFLWVSPGSPGRPTVSLDFTSAEAGVTEACFDRTSCGILKTLPSDDSTLATIEVGGEDVTQEARYAKKPGPSFGPWFLSTYWAGLVSGDVGISESYQEPAFEVVRRSAFYTLPLVFGTLTVAVLLSLFLVALVMWLPFPSLRGVIRWAILLLSITPVFILGYILQNNGVLPHALTVGVLSACVAILCIGDGNLGEMILQFEGEVRHLRSRDYIHAAGLRGASRFKHMLPGLLLPITSVSAAKVAFLLGSVVIVERLFRVPGLGEASLNAAKDGDALLLLTLTVFITGLVALVALVRDLVEIAIDPRMRRTKEDGG